MEIALFVIITLLSLALIVLILAQKKQAAGFTNAIGGMAAGGSNSYWDKNKKNSIEGKLELYTKIVAVVDAICILVVNLI